MAARSFSNGKFLSSFILDGVSTAFSRSRGYAATTHGAAKLAGSARSGTSSLKKSTDEAAASTNNRVAWAPDPKTGYYRPESGAAEIDVAELRAALLK